MSLSLFSRFFSLRAAPATNALVSDIVCAHMCSMQRGCQREFFRGTVTEPGSRPPICMPWENGPPSRQAHLFHQSGPYQLTSLAWRLVNKATLPLNAMGRVSLRWRARMLTWLAG